MGRRSTVAERLRTYVRDRVRKDGPYYAWGNGARLAEFLNTDSGWVTQYTDEPPTRHADVDTALAICDFFHVQLIDFRDVATPTPTIAPTPQLTRHQLRMLRLMSRMNDQGQQLAVRNVAGFAAAFPKPRSRESLERSPERPSATASTARETRQAAAARGKARKVAP